MGEFIALANRYFDTTNFWGNLGGKGRRHAKYGGVLFFLMGLSIWFLIIKNNYLWLIPAILFELGGLLLFYKAQLIANEEIISKIERELRKKKGTLRNVHIAQKLYLEYLLKNVASTLQDAIQEIEKIRSIYKANSLLTVERVPEVFKTLFFEKESKNRIISLLIYALSLAALIIIVKMTDQETLAQSISVINYKLLLGISLIAAIFLLSFYAGIAMLYSVIAVPLIMHLRSETVLVRHLVAQASYYSHMQKSTAEMTRAVPYEKMITFLSRFRSL